MDYDKGNLAFIWQNYQLNLLLKFCKICNGHIGKEGHNGPTTKYPTIVSNCLCVCPVKHGHSERSANTER